MYFFNSSVQLFFPFPSLPEATQIMHCVRSSSYSICFIETNSSRKRNLVRSHLADWCSLLTAQYFRMKERSGETPFQVKAYVHRVQASSFLGKSSKETYVEISLAYRCLLAWNFSVQFLLCSRMNHTTSGRKFLALSVISSSNQATVQSFLLTYVRKVLIVGLLSQYQMF